MAWMLWPLHDARLVQKLIDLLVVNARDRLSIVYVNVS